MNQRRRECIRVKLSDADGASWFLEAADVHGAGRSNKAWVGWVAGEDVDLPNLKAVAEYARARRLTVEKLYEN